MSFHMRRTDRQIEDKETLTRILKGTRFVTLAMSLHDQPYLVSLSHGYDEARNCVYFHCGPQGKKIHYLEANSRVWGQALMDFGYSGACHYRYASVQFAGTVTFVEDLSEKRSALTCLVGQLDEKPEPILKAVTDKQLSGIRVGRVDITEMTGWHNPGTTPAERQEEFDRLFTKS